jgi:hypothetical protein
MNALQELVALAFIQCVDWTDQHQQNHESGDRGYVSERVDECHVPVGEVTEGCPGEKDPEGVGNT